MPEFPNLYAQYHPNFETEVDEAIAVCRGNVREALKVTLIANAYLEEEVERLKANASAGFDRGRERNRKA